MTAPRIDHALDDLIGLDPAAGVQPQRDVGSVLEQIYRTPTPVRQARRSPGRRPLVAVGLAAAAAATLMTAPALLRPHDAYADWTHAPQAVDAVRDRATAQQCSSWVTRTDPHHPPATPILTDRRGDWALALLDTPEGPVTCLVDQQPAREPSGGTSGPLHLPATAPDAGIVLAWGGGAARDGDPVVRTVVGKVAPDVAAVTLHTAAQGDVRATLLDGWVLAWWPGERSGHETFDEDGLLAPGYDTVRLTRTDGTTTTLPADAVMTPRT